jgi:hypothetical protein
MDVSEFEKQVKPSKKSSQLAPFKFQIFELKNKGYADWQVRDWLEKNGITVSRQAIQQFCKKESAALDEFKSTSRLAPPQQHQQAAQNPQGLPPLPPNTKESGKNQNPLQITGQSFFQDISDTPTETPEIKY